MTLIPCRECKKQISENAKSCPECGAPLPAKKEWSCTGYEWKSETTIYGYPFIHIAFGQNEKGKYRVAKGVIAIGQFAIGVITIAQFGIGFLFGFGQFIFGLTAVAQFAGALIFGFGQIATGYAAIGQIVFSHYGIAQTGFAKYLWSSTRKDPEALEFFSRIAEKIGLSIFNRFSR